MLFNSISYLIFLPVAVAIFWILPHRLRTPFLLAASFLFYMSWLPVYGILLAAMVVINYWLGRGIADGLSAATRKSLLVFGLAANLLTLAYYKYTAFLVHSLNKWLGAGQLSFMQIDLSRLESGAMQIILPLGISFFVFEFIHYLVDVYKGSAPIKSFTGFSLFAAFFPSQIAGPIKRYQAFIKQLETPRVFAVAKIEQGLALILQGLFKKVAIADNLSPVVAHGFANASALGVGEAWLCALAFAAQIYCDFSGYTDMGRGSAIMLGFDLPDNFNWPYIANSLSDFWKRWHISLSTWLRDYLYIPMGGSKCSQSRRQFNLLVTMLLGGLWHGASWHFVVWGAFHGLGLVVVHAYDSFVKTGNGVATTLAAFHKTNAGKASSIVATFLFVLVGWVFFRAENSLQAVQLLQSMVSLRHTQILAEDWLKYPAAISLAIYAFFQLSRLPKFQSACLQLFANQPLAARAFVYIAIFVLASGLAPAGDSPFIYFQF